MNERVYAKLKGSVMTSKLVSGDEIVYLLMQNVPQQGIAIAFPYNLRVEPMKIGGEIVPVPILEQFGAWIGHRNAIYFSWGDVLYSKEVDPYYAELYLQHVEATESDEYAKMLSVCEEQIRKSDQAKSKKAAADYKTRH